MSEETWRPLGIESAEDAATYDALHDGVPEWMQAVFWSWVRMSVTGTMRGGLNGTDFWPVLRTDLVESMGQKLRLALPVLRLPPYASSGTHRTAIDKAVGLLQGQQNPLAIADYLLAFGGTHVKSDELDSLLQASNSLWTVGTRQGRPGLVPRVPEGVKTAVDEAIARAGRAGATLARAWELLYQLDPNPSEAYRYAIKAVEDAAVPVVLPNDKGATLGKVIGHLKAHDWKLPMDREPVDAPTAGVLLGMLRVLWEGQHDRHGGQPSAPGKVSLNEARVAVGLAVTLVSWFDAGVVHGQ